MTLTPSLGESDANSMQPRNAGSERKFGVHKCSSQTCPREEARELHLRLRTVSCDQSLRIQGLDSFHCSHSFCRPPVLLATRPIEALRRGRSVTGAAQSVPWYRFGWRLPMLFEPNLDGRGLGLKGADIMGSSQEQRRMDCATVCSDIRTTRKRHAEAIRHRWRNRSDCLCHR